MGRAEDIYSRILSEGEKSIDEFIINKQCEELFLDFKRSSDDGKGGNFNQNDRNNLAKAISGFGNSEGGVIVWGVYCSKDYNGADVAKAKHPISNITRFVSWLEGAVSGCTIPPHIRVKNHPIVIDKNDNGFALTYIPKSDNAPHQVVGKLQYYIRAGSSFVPTPHSVLAGMFGRRPQPHIIHKFITIPQKIENGIVDFEVGFIIQNKGLGIAKDLFLNISVISKLGSNCQLEFIPQKNIELWNANILFGRKMNMISKPDFRLSPESDVVPIAIHFSISPPFTQKLEIHCICGCDNAPSDKFIIENSPDKIDSLYKELILKVKDNDLYSLEEEEWTKFAENFLNI